MSFDTMDVSLDMVGQIARPIATIAKSDPDLARQLRRAAVSVPLNVAEGRQRAGRDQLHLYRVAAGSLAEVRVALEVARAMGYVAADDVAAGLALGDRVAAMLWRLTHPA